ncbi:MAG: cytochrome c oxidase accessory protein FixG [Limisphaerales bacterium]
MNQVELPVSDEVSGFGPVDLYQKREKIIKRHVDGKFQKLRFYSGWPFLLGYLGTPWLSYEGRQLVLFDLPARQFDIFGFSFWPQDLWLLGWLLMLAAFVLFTVTNIVGRLWCGYTCPQTVWTATFMWIEQFCEGSRNQRVRMDSAPWSLTKIRKRFSKHAMWLGWALLTGLTFVGYFTPIREFAVHLGQFNWTGIGGWALFWVGFFTIATYLNAGWLREQVCIYMCPYARFQSAMIDRDTLIVSYNHHRGEPRGSIKRGVRTNDLDSSDLGAVTKGDCVDCQLCVQVCPTGIDIREGLQYQCIGCAHCVDACNQVMSKISAPPDLISYTTLNALDGGTVRWLRPRSIGYAAVCCALGAAFVIAVLTRAPMDFDIIRDRGSLYTELANGDTKNDYQLKVMNKSHDQAEYRLRLVEPQWLQIKSPTTVNLAPGAMQDIPLTLVATSPPTPNSIVEVQLCNAQGSRCVAEETRFIAKTPAVQRR